MMLEDMVDIVLDDYDFDFNEIDRADITVDVRNPRTVELNRRDSTVTIVLASAIDDGETVEIVILESAGISSTGESDPVEVGGYSSSEESTMTGAAADEEEEDCS